MSSAVLDTTVIIHLFRKNVAATNWFATQTGTFSISSITWLEVMAGVANKQAQVDSLKLLSGFELCYLTQADQDWAMEQIRLFRFKHSLSMTDCLIASAAYRLQIPLYTHNLKDMTPILGKLA